jgi:hypothetical protein
LSCDDRSKVVDVLVHLFIENIKYRSFLLQGKEKEERVYGKGYE